MAGGELIIPLLMFVFGADVKTAGTASVLVSLPIVLAGVARHWLTGHFRSRSLLTYLAIPMIVGSLVGAAVGGYISVYAPTNVLRVFLGMILAISAAKLLLASHQRA